MTSERHQSIGMTPKLFLSYCRDEILTVWHQKRCSGCIFKKVRNTTYMLHSDTTLITRLCLPFARYEMRFLIGYSERQYFDPKNDFKWQITIKMICCKPYKCTFLSPKWPFRIPKPFGISKVRCFHLKKYDVSFPKHAYMLKSVYSYGVDAKIQKSVLMWVGQLTA